MGPKCNAVQCIVNEKENPKNCPSPWDFVTPPDEDRDTAIGNMHKDLVKIVRVVQEICSRTDRHTHTHTDLHIVILCQCSRGQSNNNVHSPQEEWNINTY